MLNRDENQSPTDGNHRMSATLERGLDILLAFVDQPTMTVRALERATEFAEEHGV